MKKINIFNPLVLFFVFFFTMFVFNVSAETNNWVSVGEPGFAESGILYPSIILDNDNVPHISYVDHSKIYVMKFNGSKWEFVGGKEIYSGNSSTVSLAFDKNNVPYAAFSSAGSNSYDMFVLKYNGSTWDNINVDSLAKKISGYPSIVFDKNNDLILSYIYVESEDKMGNEENIQNSVVKLSSGKWEEVGDINSIQKGLFCLSLALDYDNNPYIGCISMQEDDAGNRTFYKFNGTKWGLVTTINSPTLDFNVPIIFDSHNNIYSSSVDIKDLSLTFSKFNGLSWEEFGRIDSVKNLSAYPKLYVDDKDSLYTTYSSYDSDYNPKSFIKKYDGSKWNDIGNLNIKAFNMNITVDKNGIIYLIYQDGSQDNKISVVKYGDFPLTSYKLPVAAPDPVATRGCLHGEKFSTLTGTPCPTVVTKTTNHFIFTKSLKLGSDHNDTTEVNQLQKFLNTHGFVIAQTGNYSPGKESKYFGTVVKNALIKFQKKYGLTPDGSFGAKTRAKVNEILDAE